MKAVLVSAALLVSLLSSCGSPCGDLKKLCDGCTGTAGKAAGQAGCNVIVTAGVAQSCQAAIDTKVYAADGLACK